MANNYNLPPIVWLKITDYMHAWLQYELGGALRIKNQLVISVQHLTGARAVLKMETVKNTMEQKAVEYSMSAEWKNCIEAGMEIDPETVEQTYKMSKDLLKLFVPVECPKMCLTQDGVLRPWKPDVNFGRKQAAAMQSLLREEFWKAVGEFDKRYAERQGGKRYIARDMIEDFCEETHTPDMYVDSMRREWQRRVKRKKEESMVEGSRP